MQLIDQQFNNLTTTNQADKILAEKLQSLGFDRYSYTYYASDFRVSDKILHHSYSNEMRAWNEYFWQQNYDGIDRIGLQVRNGVVPLKWRLQEWLPSAAGKERQLFLEAIKRNLDHAVSIPMHDEQGGFAIVVLYLNENTESNQLNANISQCHSLCLHYHCAIKTLLAQAANIPSFTKRELQVVTLAAKNMTAKEIAEKLHITARTARFHFENINKKMETVHIIHAANKAVCMGIIKD